MKSGIRIRPPHTGIWGFWFLLEFDLFLVNYTPCAAIRQFNTTRIGIKNKFLNFCQNRNIKKLHYICGRHSSLTSLTSSPYLSWTYKRESKGCKHQHKLRSTCSSVITQHTCYPRFKNTGITGYQSRVHDGRVGRGEGPGGIFYFHPDR